MNLRINLLLTKLLVKNFHHKTANRSDQNFQLTLEKVPSWPVSEWDSSPSP